MPPEAPIEGLRTKEGEKPGGRKEEALRGVMSWSFVSWRQITWSPRPMRLALTSQHLESSPRPRTFQEERRKRWARVLLMKEEGGTKEK